MTDLRAVEARAALAEPESIEARIARAEAAIEKSMERIRRIAATPAMRLAALAKSQPPAEGEVGKLVEAMRQQVRHWLRQDHGYCEFLDISDLTRAADLLQRQAAELALLREDRPPPEPQPPADRLALAVCPLRHLPAGFQCCVPCQKCRNTSTAVTDELAQILRERHGDASQMADWLDGVGHG